MSELRRNLQINGETFNLAVSQYGDSSPSSSTPGKPGVLYLNTFNGNLYKCTAADPANNTYTWVAMVGAGGLFATTVNGEGAEEISPVAVRINKPNTGYVLSIGDKLITKDNYLYEITELPADLLSGYKAKLIQSLGSNSSTNGDGLTAELKNALINYYTHVMPEFDDTNGLAYINAILTALGAETRGESGGDSGGEDEPDDPVSPTVTLSSISATYSGGDVAVGTAVADLTGVVVTAHYSDGTSQTVTGYTLSGTIAEGSNTVTVTYQGRTTTFTVNGIAESTGENNGWTDGEAYTIEWTDGYKLDNSTGEETENTSSSVSDYIPCLGVSALTGAGISGGYLYAYDADKTYLGRIIFDASYPSPVNREVAYVKCYCATNSKDNVSLIPHVYEEMTETTNWEAGKYYSASYVEDTKLDYNTGVTSTHTSNWTSGFMFCYGASNITTTQIIQTSWGNKVAFYDADKNYISGAGGNQVPWEVPENAVYFRLNGFDGFEYTIQKPNRPWIQFA